MKKLLLFFILGVLLVGCEKIKKEVAGRTLTFDDIKGAYYGSIYEDLPDGKGGVSSKLYADTLSITMVGSDIVLTSRAIGTLKTTTGKVSDSTFQLFIPQQRNGKTDTSGVPIVAAEDASDVTIEKPNLDKPVFRFKPVTIGKDPRDESHQCMTRYRVVSLEK